MGVIYVPQQWLTVRTSVGCYGQAEGGNWPHSEAMTTAVFPGAEDSDPPPTQCESSISPSLLVGLAESLDIGGPAMPHPAFGGLLHLPPAAVGLAGSQPAEDYLRSCWEEHNILSPHCSPWGPHLARHNSWKRPEGRVPGLETEQVF